ncbi:MAG TPA: helix-turn-helix domain-containing protein [Armatimonadota bacterium]|nr:helix-turn-helix domain-containing protein [Armatimonadota bacterium]
MRSLEEWTKYLEQQEQDLQRTLSGETTPDKAGQGREQPAEAASPPIREPARATSSQPPRPDGAQRASRQEGQQAPRGSANTVERSELHAAVRLRKKLVADVAQGETAQGSYKNFKETREQLLERLLDPSLTLEDTARILNVCPTTVRRYTNRGLLKHFRTAGNQRRFRLSDVLAFLESQTSGERTSDRS